MASIIIRSERRKIGRVRARPSDPKRIRDLLDTWLLEEYNLRHRTHIVCDSCVYLNVLIPMRVSCDEVIERSIKIPLGVIL